MMRKWGGYLLVLGIVLIITTGGVTAQRYLDRTAGELVAMLGEVGKAVDREDWTESERAFAAFKKRWGEVRRNWAMFTDHMELDNVEMRIARLKELLRSQDQTEARAEFSEALMLIEHIPERERLTLRNVL